MESLGIEDRAMSTAVEELLHSFDDLSEADKLSVASEIIRRTARFDLPALTDDELVLNAEAVFLDLDRRESGNG
jgi:hypothetical protein